MKSRHFATVALALLCLGTVTNAWASGMFGTVVKTESGMLQGHVIEDFNTVAWLGIPYAAPPVGDLRWKAPQDP